MQQLLFEVTNSKELWFHKEGCRYHIVDTEAKMSRLCDILMSAKMIVLDIETTGLDIGLAEIVGVSLCAEEGLAFYIPLDHYGDNNVSKDMFISYLKSILESKPICGHNLKFDYKFIYKKLGIKLNCAHDTYVIAKLLDEFDSCALKYLGEVLFNYTVVELSEMMAKYKLKIDQGNMLKPSEMYEYACQDVDLTLRLFKFFWKKMDWRPDFIYDLEIGLIYSIAAMEMRGVKINYTYLKELRTEYTEQIEILGKKIKGILGVGPTFNVDSNPQLSAAILNKFPFMRKNFYYTEKTQAPKMDEDVIKKYVKSFDKYIKENNIEDTPNLFKLFSERKSMVSLVTKYLSSWIDRVETKKSTTIYTNFNSLGAATGRMSSNDPNMQNIAPKIRHAIIPRDGYYFISMDYDQVEYRILAGMAELDHLIDEINKGDADVHAIAACLLFNIDPDAMKNGLKAKDPFFKDLRKRAKTLNFGLVYGLGIPNLAASLGVTEEEAEKFQKDYHDRFLRNTEWFKKVKKFAKDNGYVLTAFGRRRRIDNLNFVYDPCRSLEEKKEIRKLMGAAYRKAVNTPIQGTSADVTKIGFNKVHGFLEGSYDIHTVLIIHDDYVFEVNNKYKPEEIIPKLKECLEMLFKGKVRLTVDHNISDVSWGAIKD